MMSTGLRVLAVTVAMVGLMPQLALAGHMGGHMYEVKEMQEAGYPRVKQIVLEEIKTPECTIEKGTKLNYYSDGSMKLDGNVECMYPAARDNLELEFTFLSPQGEQVFDKEFELDDVHMIPNRTTAWTDWRGTCHNRASKWYQVDRAVVVMD